MQHAADVTLVDPKDYLEVPMAVPRLMVAPGSLPALIAYREFLPKAELVQGRLKEVREGSIIVATSAQPGTREVPYDYLVLATGSNYEGDLVKPVSGNVGERLQHFRSVRKHLEGAGPRSDRRRRGGRHRACRRDHRDVSGKARDRRRSGTAHSAA